MNQVLFTSHELNPKRSAATKPNREPSANSWGNFPPMCLARLSSITTSRLSIFERSSVGSRQTFSLVDLGSPGNPTQAACHLCDSSYPLNATSRFERCKHRFSHDKQVNSHNLPICIVISDSWRSYTQVSDFAFSLARMMCLIYVFSRREGDFISAV